jgi:hypothetical protein
MRASAIASERTRIPRTTRRARRGPATDVECRDGFGTTLEDSVLAAFAAIGAHGEATCPVCAGPELTAAGCRSCGSALEG